MALLPLLFEKDPLISRFSRWNNIVEPEEVILSLVAPLKEELNNQLSKIEQDTSITVDKDHFQASIDVQQFKPEEITVKLSNDHTVTIEGKHEERQDEHGFISRHFVRKYTLPDDCDIKQLRSRLSSDGVLSITAPKIQEEKHLDYKEIPVIQTGKPAKSVKRLQAHSPIIDKIKKKAKRAQK